jgi:hypothetical protein
MNSPKEIKSVEIEKKETAFAIKKSISQNNLL